MSIQKIRVRNTVCNSTTTDFDHESSDHGIERVRRTELLIQALQLPSHVAKRMAQD